MLTTAILTTAIARGSRTHHAAEANEIPPKRSLCNCFELIHGFCFLVCESDPAKRAEKGEGEVRDSIGRIAD